MLGTELSERETYLIGSIVAQWGFLEGDIFNQTLATIAEGEELPKAMNNAQFSEVLKLWLARVVEHQDDTRRAVLKAQHDEIVALAEYRQAVVHSMWEWEYGTPDQIIAVRVHKKTIKRVTLTADDLADISMRLGVLRYHVRYPGGDEDRGADLDTQGGYMSRGFVAAFSGHPVAAELLSVRGTIDENQSIRP
jgi:hypothetical protein